MPADAVRWPGPRAVVAGARGADRRAARAGGPDDLVGRRDRDPPARGRRAARRHRGAAVPRGGRGRGPGRRRSWRHRRCSPAGSARTRPARCCCRGAGPGRGRRSGSSASARRTCWRSPSRYGWFPILVETYRECLSDVFDLPALREILAGVASGARSPSTASRRARASPFASSLLFDYVAAYMYDGDTPLAERRAGRADARSRPAARAARPGGAARAARPGRAGRPRAEPPGARPTSGARRPLDGVHDLLRRLGDLTAAEVAARTRGRRRPRPARGSTSWRPPGAPCAPGSPARSAGSRSRTWPAIATGSASRRRSGVPAAFLGRRPSTRSTGCSPAARGRTARSCTPEPAARWGLPVGVVGDALERLLAAGSLLRGEFRPGGAEREWCDPEVLRLLRRRSLARLRREVEPVDPAALGAVPARLAGRRAGRGGRASAVAWHRRPGAAGRGRRPARRAAASRRPSLERDVLPGPDPGLPAAAARRARRRSARWPGWGAGASAATTAGSPSSGRAASCCGRPARPMARPPPAEPRHDAIREHLATRGASFYRELVRGRGRRRTRTARCSMRCGTWSGPARSPTTRSRRSGRCAGSGPARRDRRPRRPAG